ncbi:uncharacterized protein C7orf57 homolog [Poecilia reticulata]|uniref:uncharacterized protein C7orf57 homolog n=1 Tax=Poecilia reticulata TaxID=8081 RepID=UPI0004A24E32|nr:PREDICTED: uncharacterized protein C7orf57 homolog [Poecilia reticulata]XP_008402216.1 PREDICTED: uncharacterized protein C7orf57 homolog [Poecilia reticulata]
MATSSQTSKQSGCNSFLSACTMNSENSLLFSGSCDQPGKSGVRTGYRTQDGHISQIPGLSPTISTPPEEKLRGRRVAVLESDSDYVKLAKQGGHKGLLWHEDINVFTPNPYKPPDWFCTESGDLTTPSIQQKSPGAYPPLEAPFGTNSISPEEEKDDEDNSSGKEKDPDADCNQMEKLQTSNQYGSSNYKRVTFDKKTAPVDMTKLLRFGYAEDGSPQQ